MPVKITSQSSLFTLLFLAKQFHYLLELGIFLGINKSVQSVKNLYLQPTISFTVYNVQDYNELWVQQENLMFEKDIIKKYLKIFESDGKSGQNKLKFPNFIVYGVAVLIIEITWMNLSQKMKV